MSDGGIQTALPCRRCGAPSTNDHHRKRRSQGGDDSPANKIRMCGSGTTGCHGWVHANPAEAYEQGWLVHSWDDPALVPIIGDIYAVGGHEQFETPVISIQDGEHPAPGETCPVCERRVPHPKKSTSPTTKPLAYRIPLDEYEAHLETIDAVAELLGIKETKFHRYNTVNAGMLALLQGARLTEVGE